ADRQRGDWRAACRPLAKTAEVPDRRGRFARNAAGGDLTQGPELVVRGELHAEGAEWSGGRYAGAAGEHREAAIGGGDIDHREPDVCVVTGDGGGYHAGHVLDGPRASRHPGQLLEGPEAAPGDHL